MAENSRKPPAQGFRARADFPYVYCRPPQTMRPARYALACTLAALAGCAPLRDHADWNGQTLRARLQSLPGMPGAGRPPAVSTFTFANGDRLTGVFADGQVVGTAQVDYADGKRYVGQFRHNRVQGRGTLLFPNGDRYDGQFVQGRRHGQGIYTFASGGQYRGEFANDRITGFGHFVYANGDRYSGHLVDGTHHGLGRLVSGEGRAPQEGRWENGIFIWPQAIAGF